MGNGKTYQTMLTVQRWIQANPSGVVIPLTNRRSTGSKLANDLKQIGVDAGELKEIVTGLNVPASGLDSFWSCLESLAKLDLTDLNPERPTFIILDEWNQVLWSLLNSATIKEREVIIGRFKALLTDVVAANPNSRILALDEANNDICTEYLESILGVKALKIEAVKVAKGLNLFVHTSPYDVLGLAILDILDGKRPYINVSGAGEDSKFSVHNVNALLQAVCPGKVGLALNSTNCKVKGTAESEALEDITQACLKADYVIANSVIESNFSIDACVEFSARYVINPGVTSTMFTAFQMPARPRYACPIHVWFPEKVRHVKGAYLGTGSPFKGALRNEFIADAKSILRTLSKLNLDIDLSFKEVPKQTDESTWLDYASLINATKGDWLQVQLHLYKSYGYSVKPGIATDSKWIKEELGYIKVEESDARNQAVERVQALSEAEYDVVSRKPKKSLDEHNAVTKTLVARKALLEPESVKADDVQAYFNRDFDIMHAVYDVLHLIDTVDRDTFHLEQIKHYGLSPFKLDLIKGLRRNAAKVWNKVDFQKVLQPLVNGEAFVTSEHDELIRDFGEYCYRLPIADSWKYLGSHWSKTPNLKDDVAAGKIRFESDESYKRIGWFLIKKALGKFGLKLERYRKTRVNGSQIWQYVAVQANSENLIQGFTPAMLSFYERLSDKRHDDKLKRNEIRDERNPVKPLEQSLEMLEFTSSYII